MSQSKIQGTSSGILAGLPVSREKRLFSFNGEQARQNLYVKLIGNAQKVVEVGSRARNLNQYFHEDNDEFGIDVDRNALKVFREMTGTVIGVGRHRLERHSFRGRAI